MSGFGAVFLREVRSSWVTTASWTTLAVGAMLLSIVFIFLAFVPEGVATLQPVMGLAAWMLLLVAPAIAMRSFSEERGSGTMEILQSAPISAFEIVAGKFLAAMLQLLALGGVIVLLGGVLELYARPDWGELASGLLGLLVAGAFWIALGMLASSLTDSQLVSYLLALVAALGLVLTTRLLPNVLPADWAALFFALDPTRRTDDFAIGLLDTGNLAYFIIATAALLWITTMRLARSGIRRCARLRCAIEIIGVLALMVGSIALANGGMWRRSFDLTRTRAYALDLHTVDLLSGLETVNGEGWSIHVLAHGAASDDAVIRQVDEVLARFDNASAVLTASRIDPLDIKSLGAFDTLLARLRAAYQTEVIDYESAIAEAQEGYQALVAFAVNELPKIRGLLGTIAQDNPLHGQIDALARALTRLPNESAAFELFVARGLQSDGAHPIPDHEGVRASLATTLAFWSEQLFATTNVLREWQTLEAAPRAVRVYALEARPRFTTITQTLAQRADNLEQLEALALSEAARAIALGEAAIVIGPGRGAAVIPAWQLFPRTSQETGEGTVRFDRRFRGEEVLAGAIRSLLLEERPWVVFVHAEDRRMFSPAEDGNDLFAITDALRAARFEVVEWNVNSGERPIPPENTRAVWVVVPPLQRNGLEETKAETALLEVAGELIDNGESILLSLSRSILPVLGQDDPWDALAGRLGIDPLTDRVILERIAADEKTFKAQHWQRLAAPREASEHLIANSVGAQTLMLLEPVPLGDIKNPPEQVSFLWSVEPSENRWLEREWRAAIIERQLGAPPESPLLEAVPVVAAIERVNSDGSQQRAIVVGSTSWLLSGLADLSRSLGGERRALEAPGNRALALGGAAWLAGMDDLVRSAGGVAEVSRIKGLSGNARQGWTVVLLGGLPGLFIASGALVLRIRRRA